MRGFWGTNLRVGLAPGRLVVARRKAGLRRSITREVLSSADPVSDLERLAGKAQASVVLSSHYVRFAVLPWSNALRKANDWLELARHTFREIHGSAVDSWRVRVSSEVRGRARVACAADAALIERLERLPGLAGVQPYFAIVFNARARRLADATTWFVLQEDGRLTLGFVDKGEWRLLRTSRSSGTWHESLAATLDRHSKAAGIACKDVVLCAEDEAACHSDVYDFNDLTLPAAADASLRQHLMALS